MKLGGSVDSVHHKEHISTVRGKIQSFMVLQYVVVSRL
jgi:hypothetical protein